MLNLTTNALKFTPRGEVRVSATQNGEESMTFSVADTGGGIAPEKQRLIFAAFAQADASIPRQYGGEQEKNPGD